MSQKETAKQVDDRALKELAKVSIFQKMSAKELKELGGIAQRRSLGADSVVFFEGDRSDSMYVILAGSCKVFQKADNGTEKILSTLGAGEIFGEFAMLDGHPRSASIATLEPTEMLCLSHGDFRAFSARYPEALWKVIESVCERMRGLSQELSDRSFRDVPYRLLRVLIQLAEKHGEKVGIGNALRLGVKVSTQDLAQMAGASGERVTRLLNKFQSDGLIRQEDSLFIPDMKALEQSLEYAQDAP